MRRLALALALAVTLAGCGLFEPDEFWCAQTHYFTVPDSLWADSLGVIPEGPGVKPDSVVTEWSVDGECLDHAATAGGT